MGRGDVWLVMSGVQSHRRQGTLLLEVHQTDTTGLLRSGTGR